MLKDYLDRNKKISVVGLGYVGLPLALCFAEKFKVIGFDINVERVQMMREGKDPSQELESSAFENRDISFHAEPEILKEASIHVIAVPTPVDHHKVPNLKALESASLMVGKILKPGDLVIYESTVYPGCTEEFCLPILEKESGMQLGDFMLGYSPERINPGDKEHTIDKILKVVSGHDEDALALTAALYNSVIQAGIFQAKNIKVAEAAKVIENTQRDINIAFMNELSIIFDKMNIDTSAVLEAASTKWNFLKFFPGLVGGHCIGVDPYYLAYKSEKLGYSPQMILSGRRINDGMPSYIAKKLIQLLIKNEKNVSTCSILIMGITFKENVSDIRNSKVADLYHELKDFSLSVDIVDPFADKDEVFEEYGINIATDKRTDYDAIIVAVSHNDYQTLKESFFVDHMNTAPILLDLKAMYSFENPPFEYWKL